jgi:hypothetical protein
MTREERTLHWREIIEQQESSGLSGAGFCREHGIHLSRFYHWRRRLHQDRLGGFLELRVQPPSSTPRPSTSGVLIHLNPALCIELAPDFDASTLLRAVHVLRDGGPGHQPCFP